MLYLLFINRARKERVKEMGKSFSEGTGLGGIKFGNRGSQRKGAPKINASARREADRLGITIPMGKGR